MKRKPSPSLRQLRLLNRLYQSESIDPNIHAEEFDVSSRTIYRDLETIDEVVPLRHTKDGWSIDLQRLEERTDLLAGALLRAFAKNMRLQSTVLDRKGSAAKISFAIRYHRLDRELGRKIYGDIVHNRKCEFGYVDKSGRRSRRIFSPVKLLSDRGFWYAVGYDHERNAPRNFRLDRISNYRSLDEKQEIPSPVREKLGKIRNAWDSGEDEKKIELHIAANAYATDYLLDLPLHPSQRLIEAYHEGGALFSYTISHPMEILPLIKAWIPHLSIVEPQELRRELLEELEKYREENGLFDR